jgi:hypothetical protein
MKLILASMIVKAVIHSDDTSRRPQCIRPFRAQTATFSIEKSKRGHLSFLRHLRCMRDDERSNSFSVMPSLDSEREEALPFISYTQRLQRLNGLYVRTKIRFREKAI